MSPVANQLSKLLLQLGLQHESFLGQKSSSTTFVSANSENSADQLK
ncbi:hypothetical protein ACE1TI_02155 [Alteribacillus sp. JSM 102045]